MNNELSTQATLEAVEALERVAADLGTRASQLEKDLQTRLGREELRRKAGQEKMQEEINASLAEAQATLESARTNLQARYEARKARISRAFKNSREQVLQRIEERVGAKRYASQKGSLKAEKDREQHTKDAVAAAQEFRSALAAAEHELASLHTAAASALSGYGSFQKALQSAVPGHIPVDSTAEADLNELRTLLARVPEELAHFRKALGMRLVRYVFAWIILIPVVAFALVPVLQKFGYHWREAGIVSGVLLVLLFPVRALFARKLTAAAVRIANDLARAQSLQASSLHKSEQHYHSEIARIEAEYRSVLQSLEQDLRQTQTEASDRRVSWRMQTDQKGARAIATNERQAEALRHRLEQEHGDALARLRQAAQVRQEAFQSAHAAAREAIEAQFASAWTELREECRNKVAPIYERLAQANENAAALFPVWAALDPWTPPREFAAVSPYGTLAVDLGPQLSTAVRNRLQWPGSDKLEMPLCLAFPDQGSLLLETGLQGHDEAIAALNSLMLRLLTVAPPGRLNFTILDPVGLGQNFAGIMHLADHEEQLINNRIWTQSSQIEERLGHLNEHMEKVIQMYLRNEYATIAEYNTQAGVIAEKYHFLVVADFPAGFSDTAVRRLLSIATSGARCGVYLLMHWDKRQPVPPDFLPEQLRKACVVVSARDGRFLVAGRNDPLSNVTLAVPPDPDTATRLVHQIGKASKDSSRVEVPFSHVAPPPEEVWTRETTHELTVAIGRTGATKLQYLALGKGTRQHGLVAGKTGSGKSTLFHVMITNLSLWCSPDQVEFYLVDFKKGVEFKCYGSRRLPHARVVAIESDREFGLSVLQKVDDELRRRGDLFRKLGVQDLAGYQRAGGTEKLPRSLLLIDEFQEFFTEDDKVAQTASLLLDRIVRQGRAFGIHVILGSQTLGGAYTVARTTLGQMVVRVALQCNEADAYLIMDEGNPAPRLLSRPGEGIYNDMAGAIEGNSPFQTVWLDDEERDRWLDRVRATAEERGRGALEPFVFEGNAPADIRDNRELERLLAKPAGPPAAAHLWMGAPNSIKGPTEIVLEKQSGNHVLLIGQRDEAALAILAAGLISLSAQYPKGAARALVFDVTSPELPERRYLEQLSAQLPLGVELLRQTDLQPVLGQLVESLPTRSEAPESAAPVFIFLHGLQRFNKLRAEEDFGFGGDDTKQTPAGLLSQLITEGARLGIHLIISCDSYNNVTRYLNRKAMSEFELRVLFQMSANDSASLIDNPKASGLGLHRALYFNAQQGTLETFRPYALPEPAWIGEIGSNHERTR